MNCPVAGCLLRHRTRGAHHSHLQRNRHVPRLERTAAHCSYFCAYRVCPHG